MSMDCSVNLREARSARFGKQYLVNEKGYFFDIISLSSYSKDSQFRKNRLNGEGCGPGG